MLAFTLKRLGGVVITLVVASFVVYASVYLSPGSPEDVLFGGKQPSPEVIAAVREHLGLDQGFLARYVHWLGDVLTGDLGTSLISQQSVLDRISGPFAVTFALVAYASVLVAVVGIGLGLLAGLKPGHVDLGVTGVVAVATAVPGFVAAAVLISVFAVGLGWFPAYGLGEGVGGWIRGLTLPAIALAVVASGMVARVSRAAVREESASEHVRTAVSRGISRRRIVRSHVLRNAVGPVVTVTGLQIAGMLVGAIVIESAFGLNGLGNLLVSSVQQKDFPVVQAVALVMVGAFVLLNLVADLVGAAMDPRMRSWRTS